jgi:LmbE family N-acetylglucosaminyl deacetylase
VTSTDQARPAADVAAGLGTILGVWAHPDDEVYLSGGLMAAAVDRGNGVSCVTATRGERGTPDSRQWPPSRLAPLREAELATSLAVLGVADHRQLGYPDGGCAAVPADEAVGRLIEIIAEVRPDTVLTFGPDGMTGHADHRTVCAWTTAAVRRSEAAPRLLYAAKTDTWCERFDSLNDFLQIFPPGLPPRFSADAVVFDVVLSGDVLDRKVAALHAHASQVMPLVTAISEEAFRKWTANECFRPAPRGKLQRCEGG